MKRDLRALRLEVEELELDRAVQNFDAVIAPAPNLRALAQDTGISAGRDADALTGREREAFSWMGPHGEDRSIQLARVGDTDIGSLFWIRVDLGTWAICAGLSTTTLSAILDVPHDQVDTMVATDTLIALLHSLASEAPASLLAAIPRADLSISACEPPREARCLINYTDNGFSHGIAIAGDEDAALLMVADKAMPLKRQPQIPLKVSIDIARCPVLGSNLIAMSPGDLIVIGPAPAPRNPYLNFRSRYHAPLKFRKEVLVLQDVPRLFNSGHTETLMTDQKQEKTEKAPEIDDAAVENLPVMVEFSLGDMDLTVAELRDLEPGYTFDFAVENMRAVSVRVNGRTIGHGTIVELGGHFGVRLTSRC